MQEIENTLLMEHIEDLRSILTESLRDIFRGDFYNFTKLQAKKGGIFARLFGRTFSALTPKTRQSIFSSPLLEPKFILGYQLEDTPNFYEIWYDPFDDVFRIVDNFGSLVGKEQEKMNGIISNFVEIVATKQDTRIDPSQLRQTVRDFTATVVNRIAKPGQPAGQGKHQILAKSIADTELNNGELPPELYDLRVKYILGQSRNNRPIAKLDVETLRKRAGINETKVLNDPFNNVTDFTTIILEQNEVSSTILKDVVTGGVSEYNSSRITRTMAKKFWQIWGKEVDYPFKLNIFGKPANRISAILRGESADGFFVIGYSLNDIIDMEVWYIKDKETEQSQFYVLNLTAGKLVAKKDKLRQALAVITNKLDVNFDDTVDKSDIQQAQQKINLTQPNL